MATYTGKNNNDFKFITSDTLPLDTRNKSDYASAVRFSESGRSMVEMLGVLAVIGVSSIGGIMGYSYSMDKYRANQTVNDVMLRAVDIMTQMSQGKDPNLEPEWGTKGTVYDMETIYDPENNTYGIVVDGVPSRVCQMVGDTLKTQATVYVGVTERSDTATSDPCESSEENSMEFYFEPIEMAFDCYPACGEGEICRWGECVIEKIEYTKWPTDTDCTEDSDCGICGYCSSNICRKRAGQVCTTASGESGMCYWGECLPSGCTYDKNPCRGKFEYCASPNTSNTEAFPNGRTGVCVKADFKPVTAEDTEYWVSNTTISWWDAYAGCKAIGKEIISAADLVTSSDGSEWQGEYGVLPRKELAKVLQRKLGNWGIWVAEPTDDPAKAVYASTTGGVRSDVTRSYNYSFTVCK
ncbi:MAG: hypothetical protein IKY98_02600 [Alphaproteobacteria bacterium]|nr:hypothetical protein [Alphaproteobacteria bacterium]